MPILSSASTPYNRAHHAFTLFIAGATFVLIIAGALVTSNDAALSVPDWPTTFGSLYRIPPMVGGVKFEHGHRMIAEFVGLLTIILALWTWRVDRRAWMRKLGFAALATVIAQGVLGGITVLFYLPPAVSTAHATLAQTFFCIVVSMALFTSQSWLNAEGGIARHSIPDRQRPSLRTLSSLAVASIYTQLILGAGFRHSGIKLLPHLISAVVVTVLVLWTIVRVLSYSLVDSLGRTAWGLLGLLTIQLGLGFGAYLTRVAWGGEAPQPAARMVVTTVAHVAVGALLLAASLVLALQVRHHATETDLAVISHATSAAKAVTA